MREVALIRPDGTVAEIINLEVDAVWDINDSPYAGCEMLEMSKAPPGVMRDGKREADGSFSPPDYSAQRQPPPTTEEKLAQLTSDLADARKELDAHRATLIDKNVATPQELDDAKAAAAAADLTANLKQP